MSLLVRHILDRNLLEGARLIAGEQGLDNPVLWVNFMEILDALDSLQRGELLVTTGFDLDDQQKFPDFIQKLKNRGVCAVAIQTGYYIREIPPAIIEDANRYDFPVIELPARLTFSHIMHVIIEHIGLRNDEKSDPELISLRNLAKKLLDQDLAMQDQPLDTRRHLMILSLGSAGNLSLPEAMAKETRRIQDALIAMGMDVRLEQTANYGAFLLRNRNTETYNDIVLNITGLIAAASREDRVNIWIGMATLAEPISFSTIFEQAWLAFQTLHKIHTKKGICHYETLRLLEWFDYFQLRNNSLSYAYDTLKPLIAYDSFHKGELLKTMRYFLSFEGKYSETANKLYIHRHTLNNRLEKISQLSSANLEDSYTRLHLSLALMIYDYFLS